LKKTLCCVANSDKNKEGVEAWRNGKEHTNRSGIGGERDYLKFMEGEAPDPIILDEKFTE